MNRDKLRDASVEELLKRARAGEYAALEELFSRYRPRLRALATKLMGESRHGSAGGSDVTQMSAQHAFESFSDFKGKTQIEWEIWLDRILYTRLMELVRASRRKKRADKLTVPLTSSQIDNIPDLEQSPSQVAAHREEYVRLLTKLAELSPNQRLAVWYCCLKKYTDAEAAKKMDKTAAAVRGLVRRGVDALKALLAGESVESSEDDAEDLDVKSAISSALMTYIHLVLSVEYIRREEFLADHATYADELRPRLDAVDLILSLWDDPPDSE